MDFKTKLDATADRLSAMADIAKAVHDAKGSAPVENKFQFIADGMAQRRKAWDARADRLIDRMQKLDPVAESAFSGHENKLAEAEAGFSDMESAIRTLAGANGPPISEGSPPSATS